MNKNGGIDKIKRNYLEKFNKINKSLGELIKEKKGSTVININKDGYHYKSYRHINK